LASATDGVMIAMSYRSPDHFGFPRLKGKTVLVVDDHHDSAQFLTELLQFCGATVWTAFSAAHARLHLQRQDPVFSLVICDLQMPRETGTKFMRWLRAQPHDNAMAPAVAVTAYPKDFLGTGDVRIFDAFFAKPIDAANFLRTIETIMSRPRELKRA
jgi:CheY-like chemotaxis protein